MARASVLSAEAALDRADLQLSYTQVRAPIAGQVGPQPGGSRQHRQRFGEDPADHGQPHAADVRLLRRPEESRPAGAEELESDDGLDPIERSSEDEATIAQVATLIDDDFPFAGPIDYVSNEVDAATGTIQLRAVLPNEEMKLFPRPLRPGSDPDRDAGGRRA